MFHLWNLYDCSGRVRNEWDGKWENKPNWRSANEWKIWRAPQDNRNYKNRKLKTNSKMCFLFIRNVLFGRQKLCTQHKVTDENTAAKWNQLTWWRKRKCNMSIEKNHIAPLFGRIHSPFWAYRLHSVDFLVLPAAIFHFKRLMGLRMISVIGEHFCVFSYRLLHFKVASFIHTIYVRCREASVSQFSLNSDNKMWWSWDHINCLVSAKKFLVD